MAEDHGFHPAEGLRLCANSCGFYGNPTTLNLCSKCYQSQSQFSVKDRIQNCILSLTPRADVPIQTVSVQTDTAVSNRCDTCKKRVGLTGFKCRCGATCCGTHRYAELHGCMWDYKGAGKEAIAKENPVVKAEKVAKI